MMLQHKKTFSPKQVARSIGVSEASIKRWCDKGILAFTKTAGGHRRLALPVVLDFVRDNEFELAEPGVLGLPASVGSGLRTLDQACQLYGKALQEGDTARCLQLMLDLRLAGHNMAVIGDEVIAPAFYALGDRWGHGEAAIYQERRGVEMTRHVLSRLKDTLARPDRVAPTAIGATLPGDPYSLPGHLGELVLLELRWQAHFLGSELPTETLAEAVDDLRPRVLWLSLSNLEEPEGFVADYAGLYETCLQRGCAIVVGGRALTGSVRRTLRYASYGDNLQHLRSFARSLYGSK
jgi:hypothetical protein